MKIKMNKDKKISNLEKLKKSLIEVEELESYVFTNPVKVKLQKLTKYLNIIKDKININTNDEKESEDFVNNNIEIVYLNEIYNRFAILIEISQDPNDTGYKHTIKSLEHFLENSISAYVKIIKIANSLMVLDNYTTIKEYINDIIQELPNKTDKFMKFIKKNYLNLIDYYSSTNKFSEANKITEKLIIYIDNSKESYKRALELTHKLYNKLDKLQKLNINDQNKIEIEKIHRYINKIRSNVPEEYKNKINSLYLNKLSNLFPLYIKDIKKEDIKQSIKTNMKNLISYLEGEILTINFDLYNENENIKYYYY